jgi:hypothetical protein
MSDWNWGQKVEVPTQRIGQDHRRCEESAAEGALFRYFEAVADAPERF